MFNVCSTVFVCYLLNNVLTMFNSVNEVYGRYIGMPFSLPGCYYRRSCVARRSFNVCPLTLQQPRTTHSAHRTCLRCSSIHFIDKSGYRYIGKHYTFPCSTFLTHSPPVTPPHRSRPLPTNIATTDPCFSTRSSSSAILEAMDQSMLETTQSTSVMYKPGGETRLS